MKERGRLGQRQTEAERERETEKDSFAHGMPYRTMAPHGPQWVKTYAKNKFFCATWQNFFAFQKYKITPHIITMAKGMGNGFPIGGILVHPEIKAAYGMLGTTFGGNHLACRASLAVLDVLEKEKLQEKAPALEAYFRKSAAALPQIQKIKGRGLMLGLEFDFEVAALRKKLI